MMFYLKNGILALLTPRIGGADRFLAVPRRFEGFQETLSLTLKFNGTSKKT